MVVSGSAGVSEGVDILGVHVQLGLSTDCTVLTGKLTRQGVHVHICCCLV